MSFIDQINIRKLNEIYREFPLNHLKQGEEGLFCKYPDLLLVLDHSGNIKDYFCNYYEEFFNLDGKIIGKNIIDIFDTDDKEILSRSLNKAIKEKSSLCIEFNAPVNDIFKIFEARIFPAKDKNLIVIREFTKAKRAEEALRISELRFRTIWESSVDGMRLVDADGNIAAVNKSYCEMFDVKPEDIIGRPFSRVYKDYDVEITNKFLKTFKEKFKNHDLNSSFETKTISKSNKILYVDVNSVLIDPKQDDLFEGEMFLLSIFRDITSRKKAEEILIESEHHYRTLIETSPDPIILFDLEGNILSFNKQLLNIFGLNSPVPILNKNIFDYFENSDLNRIKDDLEQLLQIKTMKAREYNISFYKDKYLPVEISASLITNSEDVPTSIVAIIRDITERKYAETALRNSEIQFRSVWENSSDGMRITDEDGKIIAINNAYIKLVGLSEKELIGKYFYSVYSDDSIVNLKIDMDSYKECFKLKDFANFKYGKPNYKSGKKLFLEANYSFLEYETGKIMLLSVFRDISERIESEEKLRQSEKLAAIGRMATYLSHEIKTPLASIGLNLEMLYRDIHLPPNKLKSLQIIHREIKRLNQMLKNVLMFSKQKIEPVKININLRNMVNSIKDLLNSTLTSKNIVFINRIENIIINADYQKMQTILLHLIDNSIEAIFENGIIELYTEENCETVDIFIRDTGCGIKDYEKIFEPFYTTKHTGTGLGLAIVKKLIEQHNGKLVLISSQAGETIFCLKIKKENK